MERIHWRKVRHGGRRELVKMKGLDTRKYGFTVQGMKTTIELPDSLLKEAKRIALERDQTLKEVMISALTREVDRVKKKELLDWVKGIRKEFEDTGWKNADQYVAEQRKGWG